QDTPDRGDTRLARGCGTGAVLIGSHSRAVAMMTNPRPVTTMSIRLLPGTVHSTVIPLMSRAERRASRRRSAHSFPAQTYARAPPWHASRYSAPAQRHEA